MDNRKGKVDMDNIVIERNVPMPDDCYGHIRPNRTFASKLKAGDSFELEGNYKQIFNKGCNIRTWMSEFGLRLLSRRIELNKIRYWVVPLEKENENEN